MRFKQEQRCQLLHIPYCILPHSNDNSSMFSPRLKVVNGFGFRSVVLVFILMSWVGVQGQPAHLTPPRHDPTVAPLVARHYPEDRNGDRVQDSLENRARQTAATAAQSVAPTMQTEAGPQLEKSRSGTDGENEPSQ